MLPERSRDDISVDQDVAAAPRVRAAT
jgi:hypothetical protein